MRYLPVLVFTSLIALAVARWLWARAPAALWLAPDHPGLRAAQGRAQATLAELRRLHALCPAETYVKLEVSTDAGEREHMWAQVVAWHGETLDVHFVGQPVTARAPWTPETRRAAAEIEDWQVYLPDGTIRGGFSTQAMLRVVREREGRLPWRLAREARRFADRL
jgi:uncharacterized protein YegJ (DUF2314 family)